MPLPNDPLFNLQWYLKNTGQAGGTAGIDINVEKVWDDYTGTGIKVGVYDDGVQIDHPDLAGNHSAALQPVISGTMHAGVPITAGNNHGTSVAGIIVASGNNNTGVVGVAYGATFGTARFLGADGTLAQQLLDLQPLYDVANHSWGSTRSYFADGDGASSYQASAVNGRGGLGVIMVKAAGNERVGSPGDEPVGRDANDSGGNTNRHAIVVGATLNTGFVADYSSPGAVLLVSAPAGPSATGLDQDISTDRTGTDGYNNGTTGTPTGEGNYAAFNGTSAATPVTSGVAALILQANNTLGWRDMQEILAYSARQVGSAIGAAPTGSEADIWRFNAAKDWNGGGLHFSNDYGFGMVDALTAVRLAETWRMGSPIANTSANEQSTTATVTQAVQAIPDNNGQSITYTFNITGAISIESAMLNLALNHTAVGDLRIILTSPNGTQSDIWRGTNAATAINASWSFGSREFYGDVANGTWTVTITDSGALGAGTVGDATLTLFGSTVTANDTYVYTSEFAAYAGLVGRNTLTDTGGTDIFNAAAVTTASTINLLAGGQSTVAGQTLTIAAGTIIENAAGGDGADSISGNSVNNHLFGGRGNDRLMGEDGNDSLDGGSANDVLIGGAGGDTLNGGTGLDSVDFSAATTLVLVRLDTATQYAQFGSGAGGAIEQDTLMSIENAIGGSGADSLYGDGNANQLTGNGDNDLFVAGNGNDTIDAGDGRDFVDASYDNDSVLGGAGDDTVYGGANNDTILGGDGIDFLYGDHGADSLDGGNNTDVLFIDSTDVFYNGGAGIDYIVWQDTLVAANLDITAQSVDYFYGFSGNDVVTANGATDRPELHGANGNDTMTGSAGVGSILLGEGGDDRLIGNTGIDHFVGGPGTDTFVIGVNGGTDYIYDFTNGTDKLDFTGLAGSGVNSLANMTVITAYGAGGWWGYQYATGTTWLNTAAIGNAQPVAGDFLFA